MCYIITMKDEKETTQAKPIEAILVEVRKDKAEVREMVDKMKDVKKLELPQGPAFINGQWW